MSIMLGVAKIEKGQRRPGADASAGVEVEQRPQPVLEDQSQALGQLVVEVPRLRRCAGDVDLGTSHTGNAAGTSCSRACFIAGRARPH